MAPLLKSGPSLTIPLWINGKEEYNSTTYDVISPLTSERLWNACSATKADTLRTIAVADRAFAGWSRSMVKRRQEILIKVADSLEARSNDCADYMLTEVGIKFGAQFLIPLAVRYLRNLVSGLVDMCESIPIIEEGRTVSMLLKEPHGVVLGILPRDAPFAFGIRSAATAIATGNTTILLVPGSTPRCYWALGKLFHDAGLSPGVLNIISCRRENAKDVLNTLIQSPKVKGINFTGSAFQGRSIAGICAGVGKPCLLDVQGLQSMIVLSDADLLKAINACIMGSYLKDNQICIRADRLIIHEDIADIFLSALKDAFLEPIPHIENLLASVLRVTTRRLDRGIRGGAYPISQRLPLCPLNKDPIFKLLLPGGGAPNSPSWMKGVFGPVVSYALVASDEEACEIANRISCDQWVGIFTENMERGYQIKENLPEVVTHINRMEVGFPRSPYGNFANESYCLFNAERAMDEFLDVKTIAVDD